VDHVEPSRVSSVVSPTYQAIERTVRQLMPDAVVAPSLVIASTDAKHYEDLSDDVYRFLPIVLTPQDISRIHGTNERISTEVYVGCVRFYVQLLRSLAW
jgi:carboxypeptidase PM20D1